MTKPNRDIDNICQRVYIHKKRIVEISVTKLRWSRMCGPLADVPNGVWLGQLLNGWDIRQNQVRSQNTTKVQYAWPKEGQLSTSADENICNTIPVGREPAFNGIVSPTVRRRASFVYKPLWSTAYRIRLIRETTELRYMARRLGRVPKKRKSGNFTEKFTLGRLMPSETTILLIDWAWKWLREPGLLQSKTKIWTAEGNGLHLLLSVAPACMEIWGDGADHLLGISCIRNGWHPTAKTGKHVK